VELPKEVPKRACLLPPFPLYYSISCYHLPPPSHHTLTILSYLRP
jgi:hypothetical protein